MELTPPKGQLQPSHSRGAESCKRDRRISVGFFQLAARGVTDASPPCFSKFFCPTSFGLAFSSQPPTQVNFLTDSKVEGCLPEHPSSLESGACDGVCPTRAEDVFARVWGGLSPSNSGEDGLASSGPHAVDNRRAAVIPARGLARVGRSRGGSHLLDVDRSQGLIPFCVRHSGTEALPRLLHVCILSGPAPSPTRAHHALAHERAPSIGCALPCLLLPAGSITLLLAED